MNEENVPILSIGIKGGYITCQRANQFGFDEFILASILGVVLDCLIDNVPENKQIEFENTTLELFKQVVEKRHNYISYGDKNGPYT